MPLTFLIYLLPLFEYDKYHIANKSWVITFYKTNDIENYNIALDSRNKKNITWYEHRVSDTLTIPSVEHGEAEKIVRNYINSQYLDISNLSVETTHETDLDVRIDHSIQFKRNLMLDDQSVVDQIISTKLSGNKLSNYQPYFDTPEEWRREYFEYDFYNYVFEVNDVFHKIFHHIYNHNELRKLINTKVNAS